jgi:hypothetical protein
MFRRILVFGWVLIFGSVALLGLYPISLPHPKFLFWFVFTFILVSIGYAISWLYREGMKLVAGRVARK